MNNLLELIHEYRTLRALESHSELERARMVGLGRLLGSAPPWGDGGKETSTRGAASYPVSFAVPGGFARGEIRTLSGAGIVVATKTPPPKGTRILLRLDDPHAQTTYVFPASIAFRRTGRWGAFGALFDGEPERTESTEPVQLWPTALLRFSKNNAPLVA